MNFVKDLTLDDLYYNTMNVETFVNNPTGLRNQLLLHFHTTEGSRSNGYKKAAELFATFTSGDNSIKKAILYDIYFSSHVWGLNRTFLPLETYRCLLILTFPIIAELTELSQTFGDNYFSPEAIFEKLTGSYGAPETVRDSVYKALKTMCELGICKKLKRGMYKRVIWPVGDALSLRACLLTATAMSKNDSTQPNPFLTNLSFQISHDFIEYYQDIAYETLIPKDVLEEFKHSSKAHTLQYKEGVWTVSDEPYIYSYWNLPIDKIPVSYSSIDMIKKAKNENFGWWKKGDQWQSGL